MIEHLSIDIVGINVHYVKAGEGPPLLLLHGLGASWVVWQRNLEVLPQCGHWPQMERMEEFNQVLLRFLASVEEKRTRVPS